MTSVPLGMACKEVSGEIVIPGLLREWSRTPTVQPVGPRQLHVGSDWEARILYRPPGRDFLTLYKFTPMQISQPDGQEPHMDVSSMRHGWLRVFPDTPPCKAKIQYLLTLQVSRYCLLTLYSSIHPRVNRV